jgi:hypothetical protein
MLQYLVLQKSNKHIFMSNLNDPKYASGKILQRLTACFQNYHLSLNGVFQNHSILDTMVFFGVFRTPFQLSFHGMASFCLNTMVTMLYPNTIIKLQNYGILGAGQNCSIVTTVAKCSIVKLWF